MSEEDIQDNSNVSQNELQQEFSQQEDINTAINNKRASLENPYEGEQQYHEFTEEEDEILYFKILCPQPVTGLIIGKGGSIINHMNATCGARIKLSQNNEYYPTTNDRILVISGDRKGMLNAVNELVTRIVEAPERRPHSYNPDFQPTRSQNQNHQIRLLIPRIASGTLIGKGGSVIKQMSEKTGCKMQLGEETDPFMTRERIFIINSTAVPSLVHGAQTVMLQLLEEPKVRAYVNTGTQYGLTQNPHGGLYPGGPGGPGPMRMGMPRGMGMVPNSVLPPNMIHTQLGPQGNFPGNPMFSMPPGAPFGPNPGMYGGVQVSQQPQQTMQGGYPMLAQQQQFNRNPGFGGGAFPAAHQQHSVSQQAMFSNNMPNSGSPGGGFVGGPYSGYPMRADNFGPSLSPGPAGGRGFPQNGNGGIPQSASNNQFSPGAAQGGPGHGGYNGPGPYGNNPGSYSGGMMFNGQMGGKR